MHVDQDDLARTAKQLYELFVELEQAKFDRPPAPEVSTTHSNRQKGPMCPGPIWAISDDAEFTLLLKELVCDAAARIDGHYEPTLDGRKLTRWLAWYAGPVSQLDFADAILDEMRHQIRELNHRLRRTRPFVPAVELNRPEPRCGAEYVARQLRARGHHVTADTIRGWARRGHITRTAMPNGRGGYLITEALTWAQKQQENTNA